ncbi:MAG: hypothetical protein JXA61_00590 [Bacteroidales bacterium]|nr:hypothetical protein [Bacteroidales bacterium]
MKKLLLLSLLFVFIGLKGYSQFAFGVAPGLSTNTAYFGFKAGSVVPYVGFQFANVGVKMVSSGAFWNGSEVEDYEDDMKISGNLYLPSLGVKAYAFDLGSVKGYFDLCIAMPLIRASLKENGDEVETFYHNGEAGPINNILKDVKMIAAEFGFGAEYFFSDHFSVGGEFGIMYLRGSFKDAYEDDVFNGTDFQEEDFETKINVSMMPTYSKIGLNFYFGGGSSE